MNLHPRRERQYVAICAAIAQGHRHVAAISRVAVIEPKKVMRRLAELERAGRVRSGEIPDNPGDILPGKRRSYRLTDA